MTISVWRYSHLALAISSCLFLVIAAVTGIILAFEPIEQKLSDYRVENFNQITIAQAVTNLKKNYPGVTDIVVDGNGYVTVKGADANGKKLLACVDARTGKILGTPYQQRPFFQWVTAFHRSLFLHEAGRIFVGLIAFLLALIATSGTVLIIQRQRGVKRFFNRIVKDNFAQYWHVALGRLLLIPIIIIALTGTYLTVSRFDSFPKDNIKHQVDIDNMKTDPQLKPSEFAVFKNTKLADVQTIQFPFSEFPEDYFKVKLTDREMVINQFTGDVLSNIPYKKTTLWANLSLTLHTGRGSIIWSLILAVASANILFFIWSGFTITLKRRSGKVKNKYKADESKIIILLGSENGSTLRYASAIYKQLIKNHKTYITELNNYTQFPNAEHVIIMTATYGLGDAPTNAAKFANLLNKYPQSQPVNYSVVGFGSRAYPDFCQFAYEINQQLLESNWAKPLIDIHTVNDRSPADFALWAEAWSQQSGISITLQGNLSSPPADLQKLAVISNTVSGHTFLIRLKLKKRTKVTSGDLLAIYPASDHRERLYSIGIVDNSIQLSVRLHENGLGSSFLHRLAANDILKARLVSNPHFHFPAAAKSVILIANGTGIAPFLGMINQNENCKITLYCGFKDNSSYAPYTGFLERQRSAGKLQNINLALSRQGDKKYVSDLVGADHVFIGKTLEEGGSVMLCGSLAMQKDVLQMLTIICADTTHELSWYQSHGQIMMDCY